MIILTKKGVTKKEIVDENVKKQVKFEDTYKVANEFVDIIAPTFGLSKGVKGKGIKIVIKERLKLADEDELRQCMLDVLKFLAVEYKK